MKTDPTKENTKLMILIEHNIESMIIIIPEHRT